MSSNHLLAVECGGPINGWQRLVAVQLPFFYTQSAAGQSTIGSSAGGESRRTNQRSAQTEPGGGLGLALVVKDRKRCCMGKIAPRRTAGTESRPYCTDSRRYRFRIATLSSHLRGRRVHFLVNVQRFDTPPAAAAAAAAAPRPTPPTPPASPGASASTVAAASAAVAADSDADAPRPIHLLTVRTV